MGKTGFEPARAIAHWILNPARLPIHLEREPPNLLETPQNTCGCAQSVPTLAGLSNGHRGGVDLELVAVIKAWAERTESVKTAVVEMVRGCGG